MRRLFEAAAIGVLLCASTTIVVGQRGQAAAAPCDRGCLLSIADTYLAALVAHDPAKAPMASNARFTEQAKMLAVGEGLWKTAVEGATTFKIPVPDPVAGQIGLIVMMKASASAFPAPPGRGGAPAAAETGPAAIQLALRLKVQNRQITEAEHVIARIANAGQLANLQTPRPALMAAVPPAERSPRQLMLLIGNSYYDSIVQSDGDATPYADDCGRRENGMHTAGAGAPPPVPGATPPAGGPPGGFRLQGCRQQMFSRGLSYITSIDLRRVWIADEEKGLVFGLTMFRQPMEPKSVTILNPDGTTSERPMNFNPFDLEAAHIFKIRGGKIHEIEAMGFSLPLYSKNGWSPFTR
jgi:hypothetical protein